MLFILNNFQTLCYTTQLYIYQFICNTQFMNIFNNSLTKSISQIDVCSGLENKSLCDLSLFQPILDNLNLRNGGPNVNTLTRLISYAASIFLILIVSFSVISILIAAWNMITDSGDGANFKKGTARFFYAIGGLIFALLSFAVVSFIIRALGRGVR
jgi:hypothetical protein